MKRVGHIIEEITKQENLEASFDTVVRGNFRKQLSEGRWLCRHREEFLSNLKKQIEDGTLEVTNFRQKTIVEHEKIRHIQVFNMKDRIAVNAVMSVVDKYLAKRYIRTTSASIKNRGMHDLKLYIERDIELDPLGTRYVYKFDIRKFYESVSQDYVMYCVRRIFKDQKLIVLLDRFVHLLPKGMSMGLRASQGLCNLLLSVFLDHYLKDRYGVRHFYRYCDDGVVLAGSKSELWLIRDIVHEQAAAMDLKIKDTERVFPLSEGLDFLGYVIYPSHSRLRKRIKKDYARKIARVKSRSRRQKLVGSLYGMAKHCNSTHLLKKLLTKKEMRKFSEMGVTYTPADGKKRFQGKTQRLGAIVNNEIEIYDYEKDVKTAHGDGRYLVSFRDIRTGEFGKFFTASEELKQILDSVAEMEDGFPFETIIRSECFEGNKFKYKFT